MSPVAPISGAAIASQSAAIVGLMMFGGLISNRASLAQPAASAVLTCDRFNRDRKSGIDVPPAAALAAVIFQFPELCVAGPLGIREGIKR